MERFVEVFLGFCTQQCKMTSVSVSFGPEIDVQGLARRE